jgi:hypothetical protein
VDIYVWDSKTDHLKMANALSKLYYDPSQPSGYSGASRLIADAKKDGISKSQVEKWLRKQDAYTKHRKIDRRFPRRHYVLLGIDDLWQADLADVSNLAKWNSGVKFWLVVIDCFSKFVWVKPLSTKNGAAVVDAIAKIFEESGRIPRNFNTDKGTEFVNAKAKTLFKLNNINFYTSENPDTKACFAERVIRTLKERLYRMLTHRNTNNYLPLLQDLIKGYNSAVHRSIGMAPIMVDQETEDKVRQKLQSGHKVTSKPLHSFEVGTHVRIAKERTAFQKGYTPGWTEEIFKIISKHETKPPMYKIEDASGEVIAGHFYHQELQHVTPARTYKIERVLRSRIRKGKKELLVKWLGYPLSMSSWEPSSEVKTI